MNVYDQAHGLAKAVQESEEYIQYAKIKEVVAENPDLSEMIKNFQGKQFEIQAKTLTGQENTPDVMNQIQELYQIIIKDPLAAQYMQAEMRFSLMMNDVYKIIGEAVGLDGLNM